MTRFLQRAEIDDEKWNSLVRSTERMRHCALTYYLDSVAPEWCALVKDDYEWIWPLPIKRFPRPQVYQPLLAQQLGPYFQDSLSVDQIMEAWTWMRERYWRLNVKFNDHFKQLPISSVKHVNVQLALNDTYESLVRRYKRNAESNTRKAANAGVEVTRSAEYEDEIIKEFKAGKGQAVKVLDQEFYYQVRKVYQAFSVRHEAETWIAKLNGQFLAGVMLLKSDNRLLNFFTGHSIESRDVGAMHALFDEIIKTYAGNTLVLDFEGSDDENLAYFYKSFGGSEQVYLQAQTGWFPPLINRVLG